MTFHVNQVSLKPLTIKHVTMKVWRCLFMLNKHQNVDIVLCVVFFLSRWNFWNLAHIMVLACVIACVNTPLPFSVLRRSLGRNVLKRNFYVSSKQKLLIVWWQWQQYHNFQAFIQSDSKEIKFLKKRLLFIYSLRYLKHYNLIPKSMPSIKIWKINFRWLDQSQSWWAFRRNRSLRLCPNRLFSKEKNTKKQTARISK